MVTKKRDSKTDQLASASVKNPEVSKEVNTDYGSCSSCNSKLVKLLKDSKAEVQQYALVCNNRECSVYRIIVDKK